MNFATFACEHYCDLKKSDFAMSYLGPNLELRSSVYVYDVYKHHSFVRYTGCAVRLKFQKLDFPTGGSTVDNSALLRSPGFPSWSLPTNGKICVLQASYR